MAFLEQPESRPWMLAEAFCRARSHYPLPCIISEVEIERIETDESHTIGRGVVSFLFL